LSSDDITSSTAEHDSGIDLDEDLFNFDEISVGADSDDADLDEIFATFDDDVDEDDEVEIGVEPEPVAAAPASEPAPAADSPSSAIFAETPAAPAAAPQAAAAPAAVAQAAPTVGSLNIGFPRPLLWLFVALTSVNALLAIVVLGISSRMTNDVRDMTVDTRDSMREVVDVVTDDNKITAPGPIVALDPANHEAFDRALSLIEEGDYARARQVLYGLLAVVDRMDPVDRAKVESRANYLIAHTKHLEAIPVGEGMR
jgi:hypothetical protein